MTCRIESAAGAHAGSLRACCAWQRRTLGDAPVVWRGGVAVDASVARWGSLELAVRDLEHALLAEEGGEVHDEELEELRARAERRGDRELAALAQDALEDDAIARGLCARRLRRARA